MSFRIRNWVVAGMLACLGAPSQTFAVWENQIDFTTFDGASGAIGTDAVGNGMAVYTERPSDFSTLEEVFASYFTAGAWQTPVLLFTDPNGIFNVDGAMDASGTALAVWVDASTTSVNASNFVGGTWTPTPIVESSFNDDNPVVAMDGTGKGVAVWQNSTLNQVRASFFSGGAWSSPVSIGGFASFPASLSVAYSSNGTAVAGWVDGVTGNVTVNNFNGSTWVGTQVLGTAPITFPIFPIGIGIDANGNALAAWTDSSTGNVLASFYNGTSWQGSPTTISPNPNNNFGLSLAMSANGTAVAVWPDSSFNGISSVFNGHTWGPPMQFATGVLSLSSIDQTSMLSTVSVSMNSSGNAFVDWIDNNTSNILSAELPAGGVWGNDELVSPNAFTGANAIFTAYSNNGARFSLWQTYIGEGPFQIQGAFSPAPSSPVVLKGHVCKDSFATQSARIKTITWTPSTARNVFAYNLYRNGTLVATVPPTGPFVFKEKRCKGTDVYTLIIVFMDGTTSPPESVTVK